MSLAIARNVTPVAARAVADVTDDEWSMLESVIALWNRAGMDLLQLGSYVGPYTLRWTENRGHTEIAIIAPVIDAQIPIAFIYESTAQNRRYQ